MSWLNQAGLLVGDRKLDFGCGRGDDARYFNMECFDPHYRPQKPEGLFDLVTCNYVLNVVTESEQVGLLQQVQALLAPHGTAFFTVRRDIARTGQPGRGCFQRFVQLDLPLVIERARFAIYKMDHAGVA